MVSVLVGKQWDLFTSCSNINHVFICKVARQLFVYSNVVMEIYSFVCGQDELEQS